MRKRWTKDESDELVRLYPTTLSKDLETTFNCKINQIYNRANKMGLHKDKE